MWRLPVVLAMLAAASASSAASGSERRLRAVRVLAPVQVDGHLDEPFWSDAPAATGFRQREPQEGEPASEDTEVRVVYDDDALYVGVLALDREPRAVISRLLERDRVMVQDAGNVARFSGDDVVAFTLDPFQDHRSAFLFATNPNGAEFDALVTDESPTLNVDWRGLWRVAAARTARGWSAEFAIPFRSLRYPHGEGEQAWGFDVERIVRRRNEDTLWSAWSRAEGGLNRVSRAGQLVGLGGLPRSAFAVELKPFALGGAAWQRDAAGQAPSRGEWRAGGDAKWELRPGLVLDATLRPDFSQVEADDQAVNLTRFELFLPEKRDFFLENAGVFEFGTRGSYETPPFLLFFSRRIGILDANEIPVLGGVRLSGRTGRQTIGVLDVLTGEPSRPGAREERRTNFGVLRVKRDVGQRGYVGTMLTDRRTAAVSETDGGVDASLWPASRLNLQAFAARTSSGGARDWAARAAAEYSGDPVYVYGEYLRVGPDARTGMGFVTRTDLRRASGKAQYTFRPHRLGLRTVAAYVGGKLQTRTDGAPQDGNGFAGASLSLDSGDGASMTHVRGYTVLDGGFALSGRVPIAPGRSQLTDTEISVFTSQNRAFSTFGTASLLGLWDGRLRSLTAGGSLRGGSHVSLGLSYTRSEARFPAGGFAANVGGLRLGWAFSTRLSVQSFVQYNDLERRFTGNFRLRLTYAPGSDLYFVVNEERGEPGDPRALLSRGVALKLSYLVRF